MKGKRCLVTGASSGIGLAACQALAKQGASLVMVARSLEKAEEAKAQVLRRAPQAHLEIMLADLADQASIRRLAEQFRAKHDRLDVLLNNAGVIMPDRQETPDGYEYTFAVNHLAYFMLACLLIDPLLAAPQGRVVSVSSEAHRIGQLHFDDLHLRNGYGSMKAYGQSKLANILFTTELARRLEGTSVVANCLHPGVVATNFAGNGGWLWQGLLQLARPFMRTPEEGASTAVYLASSADAAACGSGRYFVDSRPKAPSREAQRADLALQLWKTSEALTGATLPI
jgi:NAD(P)-dependent dehydrogenase (short-subunit alcohol dehydrogenase family)